MPVYFQAFAGMISQSLAMFHVTCGGTQGGVCVLYVMMAADIATGLLRALVGKSDKSSDGGLSFAAALRGVLQKTLMLLAVYLAALLDGFVGLQGVLRGTAIWFYIGHEGLSVMENLVSLGVPVPRKLREILMSGNGGE